MTDHYLILISAVFAVLAVLFYVAKEVIAPIVHTRLLRSGAVDVFFNITSRDRYVIKYVTQDDREHQVVDLVIPANTDDLYIQIFIRVKRQFNQTEFELGFDGDLTTKSLIKYWFLPFVERGTSEKHPDKGHPDQDPAHYVDHHKNYHIVGGGLRPRGCVVTYGFKIETRNPGTYTASTVLIVDGIEFKSALTLLVENQPVTKVRCVEHRECFISPIAITSR